MIIRLVAIGLALSALGCTTPSQVVTSPVPVATASSPTVPLSILWTRASAEHRAIFLQTYAAATARLEQIAVGLPRGSWAVILDADETVIDNSIYQQERARLDSGYTNASWNAWVRRVAATALPGAPQFVQRVHELGGRVAIVTNRAEEVCEETRENLRRVAIQADVVLCQPPVQGGGDKNPRFRAVEQGTASSSMPPVRVVMWVGDNIQDFPALRQDVRSQPDSAFREFGRSYVMLPNTMYGSWERNPLRQ